MPEENEDIYVRYSKKANVNQGICIKQDLLSSRKDKNKVSHARTWGVFP